MTRCLNHPQCADVERDVRRGTMRGTIMRNMETGEQVHFDHLARGCEILAAVPELENLAPQHDGGLPQVR